MKKLNTLLVLAALGASSSAFAAQFSELDADANGVISKEEAAVDADLAAKFDELDSNKDGVLSAEEFANA